MSFSSKLAALLVGVSLFAGALVWAQQPITSPDGGLASVGMKADTAETDSTHASSLIAFTKGLAKIWTDVWDQVNHRIKVDGSNVTQPISAVSLPLPAGAASDTTLSMRLAESTFTARLPAAFASADGIAAQTATFVHGGMMGWNSAASKWDRLQLDASDNLKVSVQNASFPVTGTFWQATQPVSLASVPSHAVTNAGTFPTQATLQTGANVIGSLSANQSVNVAQVNGVTPLMGLGASGTGAPRVAPVSSGLTGAAPPAAGNYIVGLGSGATGGLLIGIPVADQFAKVNVSTATTTLLITGVAGRHIRIISMNLGTNAANNVALISGTGATCGTGTTGMNGGTTAGSGWNWQAGGGITEGGGLGQINQTNATGDSVCVVTSAATQLSGWIGYAIY